MGGTAKGALTLASNASATGSYGIWPGGKASFQAEATWGGGSAKLQGKLPNGTAYDVATLSANGVSSVLDLPAGEYRVLIATATAVYAKLVHVPA